MTTLLYMLKRALPLIIALCCVQQTVVAQATKASRYQWQYDLKRAERQLRKADAASSSGEPLLRYAEVLFHQGKISEAYPLYQKADSLGLMTDLEPQRNYAFAAIQLHGSSPYAAKTAYFQLLTGSYQVKKFNINSQQEDFAPFAWNDKVFITSSRPTVYNKRKQSYVLTRFPYLDVHTFNHQGESSKVDYLPKLLNGPFHDGPLAIARDTSMLMLTRNYDMPDKNGTHHLYITVFRKVGKGWASAERLHFCQPTFTVQHPYFDDANGKLYFSSNMPGGRGGFDLYETTWDGSSWSDPVNLGSEVNTSFDEVFPSMNLQGQLLYASNHIESLGGLDLVLFENGERKLLPAPINSVYDDFAISFTGERSGYFTSNRGNTSFDDDIWQFEWVAPARPKQYLLSVIDAVTKQAITGLNVDYNSNDQPRPSTVFVNAEQVLLEVATGDSVLIEAVNDAEKRSIQQITYEQQGDTLVWIKVYLAPRPKPVLPAPMMTAVYFHNDRPKVQDVTPKTDYSASFRLYTDSLPNYYVRSVDKQEPLEAFWQQEVGRGWQDLQDMRKAITAHLSKGGSVELAFSGFCSPLHTDDYNVQLAKRRVQVVQRYLLGNQRASSKVIISADYFGEAKANPEVSDDLSETPLSVYAIAAMRERRVEVKVTLGSLLEEDMLKDSIKPVKEIGTAGISTLNDPLDADLSPTDLRKEITVVVGAFALKNNAEKALAGLIEAGFDAKNLGENEFGLTMIALLHTGNKTENESFVRKVRAEVSPDAWILD